MAAARSERGRPGSGRCAHAGSLPRRRLALPGFLLATVAATAAAIGCVATGGLFLAVGGGRGQRLEVRSSVDRLARGSAAARVAAGRRSAVVASAVGSEAAAEDSVAEALASPLPPNSTEEMTLQAAEAVMRAYRDGYTRQTVRLRTDTVYSGEEMYKTGLKGMLKGTLDVVKMFTKDLWDGGYMKEIKTSFLDDLASTMLYREAENPLMDAAVLYLPDREIVTKTKIVGFFQGMGDRLVVLANTEQAASPWKVDGPLGEDFMMEGSREMGAKICETFRQQSYYYYQAPFNNWMTSTFRVYPHPWEVWIQNLNYEWIQLGKTEEKPSIRTITYWMDKYEEENDIKGYQKVGKLLKDQQAGEREAAENAEPENPFETFKEGLQSLNPMGGEQ